MTSFVQVLLLLVFVSACVIWVRLRCWPSTPIDQEEVPGEAPTQPGRVNRRLTDLCLIVAIIAFTILESIAVTSVNAVNTFSYVSSPPPRPRD